MFVGARQPNMKTPCVQYFENYKSQHQHTYIKFAIWRGRLMEKIAASASLQTGRKQENNHN